MKWQFFRKSHFLLFLIEDRLAVVFLGMCIILARVLIVGFLCFKAEYIVDFANLVCLRRVALSSASRVSLWSEPLQKSLILSYSRTKY